MRYLMLGVLGLCVVSTVQAQTVDPQIVAPINKFLEAFNKGDIAGAAAAHLADADTVIIDEVPPFMWRGPETLKTWAADLEADAKKRGITNQKVTLSAPTRTEVNCSGAYVVVPAVYTFSERGVAREGERAHDVRVDEGVGRMADPRLDVDRAGGRGRPDRRQEVVASHRNCGGRARRDA